MPGNFRTGRELFLSTLSMCALDQQNLLRGKHGRTVLTGYRVCRGHLRPGLPDGPEAGFEKSLPLRKKPGPPGFFHGVDGRVAGFSEDGEAGAVSGTSLTLVVQQESVCDGFGKAQHVAQVLAEKLARSRLPIVSTVRRQSVRRRGVFAARHSGANARADVPIKQCECVADGCGRLPSVYLADLHA